MLSKLLSVAINGVDAAVVEVELDITQGLPGTIVVGLPDKAVQESRDRVKSAIRNSGYQYPNRKLVISLAPAELKKEGSVYDLPIALAVLTADEQIPPDNDGDYLVMGELSLEGIVRPVRGALAAAITAKQQGYKGVILPRDNAHEATVLGSELEIVGVSNLVEAVGFIAGKIPAPPLPPPKENREFVSPLCFSEVRGQEHVKRALEVAAAGGHNLIMMGPPGSGKTMSAQRLPTILPELTFDESLETTKIYSVAGVLEPGQGLLTTRPFRSPHHSVSAPGLIGGGAFPRPGEISLAHNGVLFLDEAPEFSRNILETLRQPLEDGVVTISRAASTQTYPAQIMLVLSMNMCPCGRLGDSKKSCKCTPNQIAAYVAKLSGPLLDRIDIHVEVPAVNYDDLRGPRTGETSAVIRERILRARKTQTARFRGKSSPVNAIMQAREIETHCHLDADCENLLKLAITEFGLSARAHSRILKVARTIADLAIADAIGIEHLSEAIQYRTIDRREAY
jgi:magnesium chelatase family protein